MTGTPPRATIRRWRKYLANERAEAQVYRDLAAGADSDSEREIFLQIAEAESRHEQYWVERLGQHIGRPARPSLETSVLGFLARRFGSVFTLALLQSFEGRSPYAKDADVSSRLNADEQVHAEVIRGMAARGREELSGTFRAAVFGANDGLVSNLALVLGVVGSGVSNSFVLMTGVAGLLAGALSMAAGEYVSVNSQKELLDASRPSEGAETLMDLDLDVNELALVYEARGMDRAEAIAHAHTYLERVQDEGDEEVTAGGSSFGVPGVFFPASSEVVGSGIKAGISSFCFFAMGALVPILSFMLPLTTPVATVVSLVLVGMALMFTGGIVGVLSGSSPLKRALRQLALGLAAAAVTYVLGRAFGTALG